MTTHVQHVVNTIEVEKPKIIKETVQRKKPIIQEKINQVTKHVEVPEVPPSQFTDKVMYKPVVAQRQIPQLQTVDKVDEMPVGVQRQIPMVQAVQKTMEIPQLQCVDEVDMVKPDDPDAQISSSRQKHFTEFTETVWPTNWEGGSV